MSDPANAARLATRAASLDVSVASFFAASEASERLAGASECARPWGRIKTVQDRSRALASLHALADEPPMKR